MAEFDEAPATRARPSRAKGLVKPTTLRVYLRRAHEATLDPDDLLKDAAVRWSEIETLQAVEWDTIGDLIDHIARRTPPEFATQCGYGCRVRDFGMVGFAMMSMPTLREAFAVWSRYCLLSGHPLVTTIAEQGDEWRMRFAPRRIMSAAAQRFCIEVSLAALERVIEELTDAPASTCAVDFSFPEPGSTDRYASLLTCNIRFGRPVSAYFGLRSDLDRPIRSRDPEVSEIFRSQCDRSLAALIGGRSISEQLEDLLLVSAGAMPSLDDMAAALGTSRRSLQRELTREHLSYQELIREFRKRRAKVLLGDASNIKNIAYTLGFKDVGSFRRAFQSWTGLSPGQWQADLGGAASCAGRPGRADQKLRRLA